MTTTADIDTRLRWQCRRGMLELDELLNNFLDRHYTQLPLAQQDAFSVLLRCADQELFGYFFGGDHPSDPTLHDVVKRIRDAFAP